MAIDVPPCDDVPALVLPGNPGGGSFESGGRRWRLEEGPDGAFSLTREDASDGEDSGPWRVEDGRAVAAPSAEEDAP